MDLPSGVAFDLGRRIRDARVRRSRSQQQIAAAAGTSTSTVSRIELGRGSNVPLGTWVSVAEAVGVDMFTPEITRDDVSVEALGRLFVEGGWAQTGRGAGVAWFDRPPRRATRLRHVQMSAERLVVRVVWVVTDLDAEFERLCDACAVVREAAGPGRCVEGIIVVIRSPETARRLSTSSWRWSSYGWLLALRRSDIRMPDRPGLVWAAPRATHLLPRA